MGSRSLLPGQRPLLTEPEQIGPPGMQKNPFTASTLTSDSPTGQFEPGASGADEAGAPPVDPVETAGVVGVGVELGPCGEAVVVPAVTTLQP